MFVCRFVLASCYYSLYVLSGVSWLYTFVGNKAKMTLKTLCFGVQQDGINAYFIIFVETLNSGAVRLYLLRHAKFNMRI